MTDSIDRELVLAACPHEVWPALSDPARLAQWLADEVAIELRPGGDASFLLGAVRRTGWVEEVSPPGGGWGPPAARLAFWWAEPEQPATRVELTLDPLPGGRTLLRVVETRPLELLDLLAIPLPGPGGGAYGPALAAAA